jgi:hypothetical protein
MVIYFLPTQRSLTIPFKLVQGKLKTLNVLDMDGKIISKLLFSTKKDSPLLPFKQIKPPT